MPKTLQTIPPPGRGLPWVGGGREGWWSGWWASAGEQRVRSLSQECQDPILGKDHLMAETSQQTRFTAVVSAELGEDFASAS